MSEIKNEKINVMLSSKLNYWVYIILREKSRFFRVLKCKKKHKKLIYVIVNPTVFGIWTEIRNSNIKSIIVAFNKFVKRYYSYSRVWGDGYGRLIIDKNLFNLLWRLGKFDFLTLLKYIIFNDYQYVRFLFPSYSYSLFPVLYWQNF